MRCLRLAPALGIGILLGGGCAHDAAARDRSTSARAAAHDELKNHPEAPPSAHADTPRAPNPPAAPTTTAGTGTAGNQRSCELAVYFASNSAKLDDPARERLDKVAGCIRRHEVDHASIEGHTDPSRKERANQDLGLERARAVAEYLRARGVPDDQIRVRSTGATAAAGSEELWPVERRAAVDLK